MNDEGGRLFTEIKRQLSSDLFDQKVMSNLIRPLYVERLVTCLLGSPWKFVGGEWTGWDIEQDERDEKHRIEVKQSAARQMWSKGKPTPPIFDIRERSGYFTDKGARWVPTPGRPAKLYIFAWHPGYEPENSVDHRDPAQWQFYVLPRGVLPPTKTVTLSTIKKRGACEADHLTLTAVVEQTFEHS